MDPYTKLQQLQQQMERMLKSMDSLQQEVLESLKENTELKVENQLLREKLDKLTVKEHEGKSQSGMAMPTSTSLAPWLRLKRSLRSPSSRLPGAGVHRSAAADWALTAR